MRNSQYSPSVRCAMFFMYLACYVLYVFGVTSLYAFNVLYFVCDVVCFGCIWCGMFLMYLMCYVSHVLGVLCFRCLWCLWCDMFCMYLVCHVLRVADVLCFACFWCDMFCMSPAFCSHYWISITLWKLEIIVRSFTYDYSTGFLKRVNIRSCTS